MTVEIQSLAIAEVKLIRSPKFGDHRGFFSETWNKRALREGGLDLDFVQDNHSFSAATGTVRGLHFQIPPRAQAKLVRVVRGAIFDVAVDIRDNSPTYGQHVNAMISAETGSQLLVPAGFAHGFMTLEENTEVLYKVTDYYAPDCDRGILWSDPDLGIEWPLRRARAVLSDKDSRYPRLRDLTNVSSEARV
ncbi:dTDP-4-dehydrorhamnose 3,5-epimerase [Bradyrhizobium sp. CCGUVB1N3]|uniref:dTDP-4-dehydrorhamnose 3,5-epimerase n=1 Tax=Bradyrhizobium sp. CCGUVB1N3 TaxID=2949629 RepID=UPI0020B2C19F|nr:dTDP-4-dehydrorhamnose 3,5-epimerase [Bradyrhizobium sp. CCGUVB1N3]MCP3475561.1 dTDP-4-dehydrorhamnose 3,5-epimerase [Bradyrhizobium sp. CCGUVB1N3]